MGAPACAVLSLMDWHSKKKIKTKKGSLKPNESAHVHNKNSNIEKANRVNCDDWPVETAAPSSQQCHLLSENYLSHYVHVYFEILGRTH